MLLLELLGQYKILLARIIIIVAVMVVVKNQSKTEEKRHFL